MPTEVMPRQKKHASRPVSSPAIGSRLKKSEWTISFSRGFEAPLALRPTVSTRVTVGSRRHSRSTPCPTMPVAPKMTTFIVLLPRPLPHCKVTPARTHARRRYCRSDRPQPVAPTAKPDVPQVAAGRPGVGCRHLHAERRCRLADGLAGCPHLDDRADADRFDPS